VLSASHVVYAGRNPLGTVRAGAFLSRSREIALDPAKRKEANHISSGGVPAAALAQRAFASALD
jgi:hypothetical protein